MNGRIMEFMTVDEVRDGILENKTVIIPMGVIEQHGYHLPLNTDVLNCYEIGKRVSAGTGCFLAPAINYSFSGGELPGTFNIHPATLSLYLNDIMKSCVNMGFKNIIVLIGHAGTENLNATHDAIDMFMRLNPQIKDVAFAFLPVMKYSKFKETAMKDGDFHAGWFETSRIMYWAPELVRENRIVTDSPEIMKMMREDQDAYQVVTKPIDEECIVPYIKQHPDIKVGVMGNPSKATKEIGEEISKDVVEKLSALVRRLESRRIG